ncbi:hypothetical protein MtrunA17_Chr4g0006091 [Medicago truncatula]|uniref:DUF247 domain protein n=1 Tax=Medicago truncatula TaxID=3880 RepID=A0A396I228_MEDTR|nr:hypothetical protein MtrunA17_Chr4g0006091 [Medicago truncatula]
MNELFIRESPIQEQNRTLDIRLKECGDDILRLDKVICASYGGSNNNICETTESQELAKIMLVDGCFLLEFLFKLDKYMEDENYYNNDSIFKAEDKVLLLSVLNDVTMLENQIPFIILKKIFRKVFPDGSERKDDHRVANLVRLAFGYPLTYSCGGAHILNLMHMSTVEQNKIYEGKKAKLELLYCATKLRASGGELNIPPLYIKETTEVKWRNLIAWEQSKNWIRCKYTSYALFFNGLICCEHDIELLQKKGVIVNELNKSNEDLLILFQTIAKGAEQMDLSYSEICARLNVYDYMGMKVTKVLRKLPIRAWHQCRRISENFVNYGRNWYKVLIRDHIPTVWKFIGIVAAALLVVLTIVQTYYSSRSG